MIYPIVAIGAFLIASYTDLKKREVPELLSISLIAAGLLLHALESIMSSTLAPLLSSAYMTVLVFLFSFFLYKIGAWAGGDVKLFTGLGAILPSYGALDYLPFVVFAASFLAALPFAIIYISYFLITVKKLRKIIKPALLRDFKNAIFSAAYIIASYEIISLLGLHWVLTVPLIYLLYKIRVFSVPFVVVALTLSLLSDHSTFLSYFSYILATSFLLLFGLHSLRIAIENVLRREVRAKDLREGMIPAEDVYIGKVKVADSKLARGLTEEELKKVRRAKTKLKIKMSIPFVPVITFGLFIVLLLEKVIK